MENINFDELEDSPYQDEIETNINQDNAVSELDFSKLEDSPYQDNTVEQTDDITTKDTFVSGIENRVSDIRQRANSKLEELNSKLETATDDEKIFIQANIDKLYDDTFDKIKKANEQAMFLNELDKGETTYRGMVKPLSGATNLLTKGIDSIADTELNKSVVDFIKDNEKQIDDYLKNNNIEKGDFINDPSVRGQVLSEVALLAVGLPAKAGLWTATGIEGVVGASSQAGTAKETDFGYRESTTGEILKAGATNAVLTYGAGKTFKVIDDIIGGTDFTVKKMLEEIDVPLEEVTALLKGVPKDKQAEVLAGHYAGRFEGNYKKAIAYSDRLTYKLQQGISERSKAFDEARNLSDFKDLEYNARTMYKTLEDTIKEANIQSDVSDLTDGLGRLVRFNEDTPLGNEIKALTNKTSDTGIMSGIELLEMRESVNKLLAKFKGKDTKSFEVADTLKKNIDKKIKDSFPTDASKFVDDTLDKYQVYKEQKNINDIIDANKERVDTASNKSGLAYDYTNISKQLEENGLYTDEGRQALNLIQEMDYKFGSDFNMFKHSKTKGEDERGGVLGFMGAIINEIKVPLAKVVGGEFGQGLKIQSAIKKSIESSNTGAEFILKLSKNKDLSKEVRKSMLTNVGEIEARTAKQKAMMNAVNAQAKQLGLPKDWNTRVYKEPLYASQKGSNIGDDITDVRASRELERRRESARRGKQEDEVIDAEIIDEATAKQKNIDSDIIDVKVRNTKDTRSSATKNRQDKILGNIDALKKEIQVAKKNRVNVSKNKISASKKRNQVNKYNQEIARKNKELAKLESQAKNFKTY